MKNTRWTKIMQEVDRLYHLNTTSEGRIACITDYICGLVTEREIIQNVADKHEAILAVIQAEKAKQKAAG